MRTFWLISFACFFLLSGCIARPPAPSLEQNPIPSPTTSAPVDSQPAETPLTTIPASVALSPPPTPSPIPLPPSPTPFPLLNPSPPCGQLLPAHVVDTLPAAYSNWAVPPLPAEIIPDDIQPALAQLFEHPEDVSIVAFKVGYEGIGFFHNADRPMPLASVSKLINLVALDQAITTNVIDPLTKVELIDLEAFYLPRSDLGAHNQAVNAFQRDRLTIDDTAAMMIRYSSNSAADYIQALVGQAAVEQTIIDLNMGVHSAPCPFLGRLIGMADLSQQEMITWASDPVAYGAAVTLWTDLYRENLAFRSEAERLWGRGRQPSVANQTSFVNQLETKGTAAGYASLMASIATGEVGSSLVRRHLAWPLEAFEDNQLFYDAIGYKNGTMPGVLTTAYYSQPHWSDQPLVVIIFYKNLDVNTYRRWRRTLPNDALAHWLMRNPQAIHIMHVLRDSAIPTQ